MSTMTRNDPGAPMTMNVTTSNGPVASITITELADAMEQHYRKDSQKNADVRDKIKLVRKVLSIVEKGVGLSTVASLEQENIDDIIRQFEECNVQHKPNTQQNRLRMLFAIIRCAYNELGILRVMPRLPSLPQIDELPKSESTMSPPNEDIRRYFDQLAADNTWRGQRQYVVTCIIYLTRLPESVACGLRLEDVDLKTRTLRYRVRYRSQPIESRPVKTLCFGDDLALIFVSWIPQTGCEWLIPGWRRKGPMNHRGGGRWSLLGRHKVACRAAGIRPFSLLQLRRAGKEQVALAPPFAFLARGVVLRGEGERPLINGRDVHRLTGPQYQVVDDLINAGTKGLSFEELTAKKSDAAKTLKRLLNTRPEFAPFFALAGRRGVRYHYLPMGSATINARRFHDPKPQISQ
jgi:integrase